MIRNKLSTLREFLKKSHPEEYKLFIKMAFVDESYKLLRDTEFLDLIEYEFRLSSLNVRAKWLDEFMDLNSEVFVEYPLKKYLGIGAYGAAFETEDGNIIKLFKGAETYLDYVNRKKLYERGEASKYDVKIYDIGLFTLPKYNRPYYKMDKHILGWIVMEKLYVPEYIELWSQISYIVSEYIINNDLDRIKDVNKLHKAADDIKIQVYNSDLVGDENISAKELLLSENISDKALEEFIWFTIITYQRGHNDFGVSNFGFRGEQPVGFDTNTPPAATRGYIFKKYPEMNVEYEDEDEDEDEDEK